MRAFAASVKKPTGFCLAALSIPASAAALRIGRSGSVISRRSTGKPALAKWAAIRAPIVPAPRTATRRSGVINASVSQQGLDLQDLFDNQAIPLDAAAERHLGLEGAARPVQHRASGGNRLNPLNRHGVSAFIQIQKATVGHQQG